MEKRPNGRALNAQFTVAVQRTGATVAVHMHCRSVYDAMEVRELFGNEKYPVVSLVTTGCEILPDVDEAPPAPVKKEVKPVDVWQEATTVVAKPRHRMIRRVWKLFGIGGVCFMIGYMLGALLGIVAKLAGWM